MNDNLDVNEWIRFAQMDYDHAQKTADTFRPLPIEIICYHCQQSAEKILKAYTIAKDGTLTKTHDLVFLLEQCKQHLSDFNNFSKACITLRTYASFSRYPSNTEIEEQDMNTALKDACKILEFTKSQLAELGYETKQEIKTTSETGGMHKP